MHFKQEGLPAEHTYRPDLYSDVARGRRCVQEAGMSKACHIKKGTPVPENTDLHARPCYRGLVDSIPAIPPIDAKTVGFNSRSSSL